MAGFAQDAGDLATAQQAVNAARAQAEKLDQQAQEVAREQAALRADLKAAARAVRDHERELDTLDDRLAELRRTEARLTEQLAQYDEQMVQVLLALQRFALRPAEALIARPGEPEDAVRAAILLRAAAPAIRDNVSELDRELAQLYAVRRDIDTRRARQVAVGTDRAREQDKLTALLARKAAAEKDLRAQRQAEQTRLEALVKEADSLRDLMAALEADKRRRQQAMAKAALESRPEQLTLKPPSGSAPDAQTVLARRPGDLGGPGGAEAGLSALDGLAAQKGKLPYPVIGSVRTRYGQVTRVGTHARGIEISARPSAPVIAPHTGAVMFAGPFRGYGLLLIIEHGDGYHTLLAGMDALSVRVGQVVDAGEPIGSMPSQDAPVLYVELRKNGEPVNPLPWLASGKGTSHG